MPSQIVQLFAIRQELAELVMKCRSDTLAWMVMLDSRGDKDAQAIRPEERFEAQCACIEHVSAIIITHPQPTTTGVRQLWDFNQKNIGAEWFVAYRFGEASKKRVTQSSIQAWWHANAHSGQQVVKKAFAAVRKQSRTGVLVWNMQETESVLRKGLRYTKGAEDLAKHGARVSQEKGMVKISFPP